MISELNIMRLCLYNTEYRLKVFHSIKPEMFDSIHIKEIYKIAYDFEMKYGTFPEDNIEILIMNNPWKNEVEVIKQKLAIVKECDKDYFKNINLAPYIEETEKWWKKKKFGLILRDGTDMFLGNGDIDFGSIDDGMSTLQTFSYSNDDFLSVNDIDGMIDYYLEDENRLKFYSEELNKILGGGLIRESINVFMGGTHSGKTRLLINLANDLTIQSKNNNVLYITLEIPKMKVSSFSDMVRLEKNNYNIKDIVRNNVELYRKKKIEYSKTMGTMYILEYPAYSITPAVVKGKITEMIRKGFGPCAVFIDYLTLMEPTHKYNNSSERGIFLTTETRSIAQELSIPIITAVQPNRGGNKALASGISDMMDVGESKGMPDASDLWINIINTEEHRTNGTQSLFVEKNRHSGIIKQSLLADVGNDYYKVEIISAQEEEKADLNEFDTIEIKSEKSEYSSYDFSKPQV